MYHEPCSTYRYPKITINVSVISRLFTLCTVQGPGWDLRFYVIHLFCWVSVEVPKSQIVPITVVTC